MSVQDLALNIFYNENHLILLTWWTELFELELFMV